MTKREIMESINRRTFLRSVAASMAFSVNGQLAFSQDVSGAEQMRIRESLAGRLAADLPSFDGSFVFDQSVCRAMATDYGHHVGAKPQSRWSSVSSGQRQCTIKQVR
jgi:hypothetical protein